MMKTRIALYTLLPITALCIGYTWFFPDSNPMDILTLNAKIPEELKHYPQLYAVVQTQNHQLKLRFKSDSEIEHSINPKGDLIVGTVKKIKDHYYNDSVTSRNYYKIDKEGSVFVNISYTESSVIQANTGREVLFGHHLINKSMEYYRS